MLAERSRSAALVSAATIRTNFHSYTVFYTMYVWMCFIIIYCFCSNFEFDSPHALWFFLCVLHYIDICIKYMFRLHTASMHNIQTGLIAGPREMVIFPTYRIMNVNRNSGFCTVHLFIMPTRTLLYFGCNICIVFASLGHSETKNSCFFFCNLKWRWWWWRIDDKDLIIAKRLVVVKMVLGLLLRLVFWLAGAQFHLP